LTDSLIIPQSLEIEKLKFLPVTGCRLINNPFEPKVVAKKKKKKRRKWALFISIFSIFYNIFIATNRI